MSSDRKERIVVGIIVLAGMLILYPLAFWALIVWL